MGLVLAGRVFFCWTNPLGEKSTLAQRTPRAKSLDTKGAFISGRHSATIKRPPVKKTYSGPCGKEHINAIPNSGFSGSFFVQSGIFYRL
jgi:hypothetical protein